MAAFDDSDDIKISTSLDTEGAVKAAQDLKTSIDNAIKATANQFSQLEKASKQLTSVLKEQNAREIADTKAKLDQEVKDTANAAAQEVAIAKKTADEKIKAVTDGIRQTKAAQDRAYREERLRIKEQGDLLKNQNAQILLEAEKVRQKTALIKRTPRAELPDGLGGIASSGKGLQALGNVAASVTTRFGLLTSTVGNLRTALLGLGPVGSVLGSIAAAATVFAVAVNKLNEPIDKLAKQAGNLEGLKVGFETLQRSVGQNPAASINALREATQGLISDTELYQRANQAVLLGVPTKTFNEAAAAAVKLGRAMGIDAAFGLESLSLGLGRQSRLYLDNLGIVVSAEEAYLRFAQANNIVGRTLTDSEKKAAFFEEALRKIKERSDELPEILDSVGISLKKVEVAQSNVSAKFLEGFNRSTDLAKAYGDQAKLVQGSADTFERLGAIAAAIGTKLKNLQNILVELGIVALTDVTKGLDSAFSFSKQQQYEDTAAKIAEIERKIKDTTEALNDPRTRKEFLPILRRDLQASQVELAATNKILQDLGTEIGIVQVQGANGIKIKVDLTDLNAAKLRLAGFIDELQAEVLAAGGEFEIPGLSKETISTALKGYEDLIKTRELGLVGAEDAKQRLSEIVDPVALELQRSKLKDINTEIALLTTKQVQLTVATGSGTDEISNQIKVLEKQKEAVQSGAGISEEALEKLKKAYKNAGNQGLKAANDVRAALKQQSRDSISAAKKQDQEWDKFLTNLKRQLGTAIDPDIQQRLADVFRTTTVGSDEMIARLQELGREVEKRKGDLNALAKEAGDYLEVAEKGGPILSTAKESKAATDALEDQRTKLQQIQNSMLNLRKIFTGEKEGGGGFFGFDLGKTFDGEIIGPEVEAELANQVQGVLAAAFQAGADGFTREDVPAIASAVGAAAGAALAASFGIPPQVGASIGGALGDIVGNIVKEFGKDTKGTRERKEIDKYFADLFDGNRLGVVIEGEIFKATRKRKGGFGATIAGGLIAGPSGAAVGAVIDAQINTVGEQIKEKIEPQLVQLGDIVFNGFTRFAGDVRFGIEEAGKGFNAFSSYFNTLPAQAQQAFFGVGAALGELQGISAEQAKLIGVALTNNIGGSLQNLQILVQQTGYSFEELGDAILKSFLDGKLTIEETYTSLLRFQQLAEQGIPGAFGAWEEALKNFKVSFEKDNPGLYLTDSLKDFAVEAKEAGLSFDDAIRQFGKGLGLTADQVELLVFAIKNAGISSFDELAKAGDRTLISFIERLRQIKEGVVDTQAEVAQIAVIPETPKPTSTPSRSSGSRGKSPEEIARDLLKQQRDEARRLLETSQEYLAVIEKVNKRQISLVEAGKNILALEKQLFEQVKQRDAFQKAFDNELGKGRRADKALLADLAAAIKEIEDRLKKATEAAKGANRQYTTLNITGVLPLIKSQNDLALIARQVGVDLQKNVDILVKGFIQGRLSISEVNDQIKKTKELLGPGIPNAVGAVTQAFQNLLNAGEQGGQFSLDAFTDIFAEFREKFNKEGSALRKAQGDQLRQNLDAANAAARSALGPEALEAANKTLQAAEKALKDFYAQAPVPDLANLRVALENTFDPKQIALFFQALGESGLSTFEDFEKAGDETIITILGRLKELGFQFGTTSDNVKGINQGLQDAEKSANAGLDPLKEAIELVKQFNNGAESLPPVFDATTDAVDKLNGPLTALSLGFQGLIEKLGQLSGLEFKNDVVFNVRTTGEAGGRALVELIFGDGSDISSGTGGDGPGLGGSNTAASERARIRLEMAKLRKNGLTERERRQYNKLKAKLKGLGG